MRANFDAHSCGVFVESEGRTHLLQGISLEEPKQDGTPLPDLNPESAAALAAVKAAVRPGRTAKNATPAPSSRETPAFNSASSEEAEQDRLAAMLLGLDDGEVPGGSTVVDVPVPVEAGADGAKPGDKPTDKKAIASREDTSSAASDILRKYMRRPR